MDIEKLRSPSASPDLLRVAYRELQGRPFAETTAVLRALVENPGCPEDVLQAIAWKFPLSAAQNAGVSLHELSSPGWLARAFAHGAKKMAGLTRPTPEQAEFLTGFSSAQTSPEAIRAALRAYVDIRLEEAPPAIDWPFLAALEHPGLRLPDTLRTDRALGLRTLEAVGRRIDARRISRGRAFAAAGDPGWNPLFRIPGGISLEDCRSMATLLRHEARQEGLWEKRIAYRYKALAGILGYAVAAHGRNVGHPHPLAIDEAVWTHIPSQRRVERPWKKTVGCCRIAAWTIEAFPGLPVPVRRMASLFTRDPAHAPTLAKALRPHTGPEAATLDPDLRRYMDACPQPAERPSSEAEDLRILAGIGRLKRERRNENWTLSGTKEPRGWRICLGFERSALAAPLIPHGRASLLAHILRLAEPATLQDLADALEPLSA